MPVLLKKYPSKIIEKDKPNSFNCGYLFLEKIYYELGLNKICEKISKKNGETKDMQNTESLGTVHTSNLPKIKNNIKLFGNMLFSVCKKHTQNKYAR